MADEIITPPVSQENVRLTPNFNKYLQKLIYSIPVINDPNYMDPVMLKVLGAMTGVRQVIFSESADAGKSTSGDTITFIEEDGTTKTASLSFQLASGIPADQSSLKITSSNNKTKSKNNKNKDGWYDDGHGCYMYYKDNERVYGQWIEENGKYYYIDKLGYMVIGWETIDGHKYYFKSSGEMVTHWRKIFDEWYFFDEIKGYMKTNKWIKYNGSYYYVDNLGHMVIGWKSIEDSKYYFNDLGEMVTGWKNIKGKWYYFDEDSKMATGEREILGRTYDFKSDGSKDGTFPPLYIIDDFYFPIPEDNSVYWENMNFAAQLMYLHQLYHGFISEKQKEYVSKKAILGCTYGTKLTRLDATKAADISYLTDGSPVLGCDDCKVGENIHSFLSCRAGVEGCKGMPYREKMKDGFQKCIPMVEESWKQDNDNTPRICRDNGYTYEYALKKDAILVCKYKGIIGILEVMEDEIQGMISYSEEFVYTDKDGNIVKKIWNISNDDFTDSIALSQKEITNICQAKNPGLVTKGFDIAIYKFALNKGINPKIILATLAQEQSWCKNGNYEKAFGVGEGGNPINFAQGSKGGLGLAMDTYLKLFHEGLAMEKGGGLPALLVNYDPSPYKETKAVFGNDTAKWQANNPKYVAYMEKGQSIMPVNAAMYAKLKYTPWVDFPPQGSYPLDTWLSIYNSF